MAHYNIVLLTYLLIRTAAGAMAFIFTTDFDTGSDKVVCVLILCDAAREDLPSSAVTAAAFAMYRGLHRPIVVHIRSFYLSISAFTRQLHCI